MNKHLIKRTAIALALALSASTASYADHIKIDFPWGPGEHVFFVTAAGDQSAKIKIDTHNIDLRGACGGPDVSRRGHLQMTAAKLNTVYFNAVQDKYRTGNITVDSPANVYLTYAYGTGGRAQYSSSGACLKLKQGKK